MNRVMIVGDDGDYSQMVYIEQKDCDFYCTKPYVNILQHVFITDYTKCLIAVINNNREQSMLATNEYK